MKKYTDEELINTIKKSKSRRDVFKNLNLNPSGNDFKLISKDIIRLNIDISHFLKNNRKKPIDDYLNNKLPISSTSLKERLFVEGFKEKNCEICHLSTWMGKSIILHLDHIDGNHFNNQLKNLRILCPNCHSQTDTYCGKNKKGNKPELKCKCGKVIKKNSMTCNKCVIRKQKIIWPSDKELEKLLWSMPKSKLKIQLGVSDVAINKRCKKHNIKQPPIGYWIKKSAPL